MITNSSSELFVLNGETLNSVKELVESIYPEYRKEYEEIVALRDASDSDVDTYASWIGDPFYDRWNYTKNMSKEELLWMKKVTYRYATPNNLYKYAQVLLLNNQEEKSKHYLDILNRLYNKNIEIDALYSIHDSNVYQWKKSE